MAAIGSGRAAQNFIESLATPEYQALLGSLGLRPLTGEAQNLMRSSVPRGRKLRESPKPKRRL